MFDHITSSLYTSKKAYPLLQQIFEWSVDYRTPLSVCLAYIVIVTFFSRLNQARQHDAGQKKAAHRHPSRFSFFNLLVIAHNVGLCLFSLYTFVSVLPILYRSYTTRPLFDAFCDTNSKAFNEGIGFWIWVFYLSKYYELLDTVILLLKGKPSSFLQTFHHSGSILGMWSMTIIRAPAAWIFVLFNSFIHTIMYFYYTLTCFGYRPSWKKLLTSMQITQFLIGNPLGISYVIIPGCFNWTVQYPENVLARLLGSNFRSLVATIIFNFSFVAALIFLFNDFSKKTYGTAPAAGKKQKRN